MAYPWAYPLVRAGPPGLDSPRSPKPTARQAEVSARGATIPGLPLRGGTLARHSILNLMLGFRGLLTVLALAAVSSAADGDWPHWRGPNDDGMARGDAPLRWSDGEHIAWKAAVPGRGHSSPVVWGDRIFVTTAVPAPGSTGGLAEHKFMV